MNDLVNLLAKMAGLYATLGDEWRAKAYKNASRAIETAQPSSYEEAVALKGVGKGIAAVIGEFLRSGTCTKLEELQKTVPQGLDSLLTVPGIGPKTATRLWDEHGIGSLDALEAALDSGKIENPKLRDAVKWVKASKLRHPRTEVEPLAVSLRQVFEKLSWVHGVEIAGSWRRMAPTVKDLDVLVSAEKFTAGQADGVLKNVGTLTASGPTRCTLRLKNPTIQVDVRIVHPKCWGAALIYFTGSKDHNISLRRLAIRKGYFLSEYGLYDEAAQKVASETEAQVYEGLGLPWHPPAERTETLWNPRA